MKHVPESLSIDGAQVGLQQTHPARTSQSQSGHHLLQGPGAQLAGMGAQVIRRGN